MPFHCINPSHWIHDHIIGNQSYDYLLSVDQRFATGIWAKFDHKFFEGKDSQVFLFSALLGFRSITALTLLVISLVLAIAVLVGFNYSDCREDQETFEAWLSIYRYIIGAAYMLFLAGTIYAMSSIVLAGFGNYPKYCNISLSIYGAWGKPSEVLDSNGQLTQGCTYSAMDQNQGAVNISVLNILTPILVVGSFLLSVNIVRVARIVRPFGKWARHLSLSIMHPTSSWRDSNPTSVVYSEQ